MHLSVFFCAVVVGFAAQTGLRLPREQAGRVAFACLIVGMGAFLKAFLAEQARAQRAQTGLDLDNMKSPAAHLARIGLGVGAGLFFALTIRLHFS